MKQVINTFYVYSFEELNKEGKERAINDYLQESFRNDDFEELIVNDLLLCKLGQNLNNELKIQYSLSSSQGDGVNIYGSLELYSVLKAMIDNKDFCCSEKELRTLLWYFDNVISSVDLKYNYRYCYCVNADNSDEFLELFEEEFNNCCYKNFNTDILKKFFDKLDNYIEDICIKLESKGYDFFYELSEEDAKEIFEEHLFNSDGSFYCYSHDFEGASNE